MRTCDVKLIVGLADRRQGTGTTTAIVGALRNRGRKKTDMPIKYQVGIKARRLIRRNPDDCSYEYRHMLRDVP